ncbi:MAG: DUF5011 domain-containing protein [Bacilli bacterium]
MKKEKIDNTNMELFFSEPKKKKHFLILIPILIVLSIVSIVFLIPKKDKIVFKLVGNKEILLEVFKEYKELGASLTINGEPKRIKIKSNLKTDKIGTYKIKYNYNKKTLSVRTINVIDKEAPSIILKGEKEVKLLETANYQEAGFEVKDNYTKELKVVTEGTVDTSKVGKYTLKYIVEDESKNKTEITRDIIIEEKPKEIIKTIAKVEIDAPPPVIVENRVGLISNLTFTKNGVYIKGCAPQNVITEFLNLGTNKYPITGSCYEGEINLSNITNGTYTLKINNEHNVVDTLVPEAQIKRGRVGNKLATFDYTNNFITVTIKDFYYDYDVLIDVGHGGYDVGASNNYAKEKDMNLQVSLYEKSLFESAGYKVLITRDGDYYPPGMGPTNWKSLRRTAYKIGYYSATSKVTYSNHHNAVAQSGPRGFQMYVSTKMQNMGTEFNIFNQVNAINPGNSNGMFTREYYNGQIASKGNGQYYDWTNYYAVLRIPADLFNNNHITIYESCFLSNIDDFINYWQNGNWQKISQIKVNNYIAKIKNM